jgi:hypothetical protein
MLFLVLSLFAHLNLAHADSFPGSMLLMDLPDRTKLLISKSLEMGTSDFNGDRIYHCGLENGSPNPSRSMVTIGVSLNSQVIIQTNVTQTLESRVISRSFYNEESPLLNTGTYCLSKKESTFNSDSRKFFDTNIDYLFFRDCESDQPALAVYAIAGYHLRNKPHYRGYTIQDFMFQTGNVLVFLK